MPIRPFLPTSHTEIVYSSFFHTQHPDAGIQVPAGTVEERENLESGVVWSYGFRVNRGVLSAFYRRVFKKNHEDNSRHCVVDNCYSD